MQPVPFADVQAGFGGGWSSADPLVLTPTQFQDWANVRVTAANEITPRSAAVKAPVGVVTNVRGAYFWRRVGATSYDVIVNSTGGVYRGNCQILSSTTFTMNATLLGSIGVGPGTSRRAGIVAFRDGTAECVYIAVGSGKLSKWDGTTFTANNFGASVGLRHLWVYNQRLYGITCDDQTVYWSALNNGDSIGDVATGGGFATVRTFSEGAILSAIVVGGSTLLFHKTGISRWTGTTVDDIAIGVGTEGVSSSVGILADGAAACRVVEGIGYFVARDGSLYRVNESGIAPIETPVTPDPTRQFFEENGVTLTTLLGYHRRARELWVDHGSAGFGWNTQHERFALAYTFTGTLASSKVSVLWESEDNSNRAMLLMGDTAGNLYAADLPYDGINALGYTDPGGVGGYTSSITCRRFLGPNAGRWKDWRRAFVTVAQTVSTLGLSFTTADGTTASKSMTRRTSTTETATVELGGSGEWADVTLSGSGSAWTVSRVEAEGFLRAW